MAQIIKHRRGSLESLSAVTSSLQKGEIVIASGSSNLTVNNGSSIVFVASEAGQVQAVNRFLMGTNAPNNFAAGTYNGMLKGVPYYASGSATLYLLGEGTNDIPNLVGNIQPFSTSVDSRLDSLEATVGGGENGSLGSRVIGLESKTGSYATTGSNTFTANQTINGNVILGSDGQIQVHSATASTLFGHFDGTTIYGPYYQMWGNNHASAGQRGGAEFVFDSRNGGTAGFNIAEYNGTTWIRKFGVTATGTEVTGSLTATGEISGSSLNGIGNVTLFSQSVDSRFDNLESYSSSNDTTNTSQNNRLTSLESFSGSQVSKNSTLATYTASVDSHISNVNSFTASASGRLTNLESYTSSNDTTNTAQNNRLTTLESATGSYAKLSGGNTFTGTQIITGSLFVTANLVVQGSSSLQNITASAVDIGTNIVKLNTSTPAVRFGGISVQDSGSSAGVSGSLFWDSLNNHWLYVQPSGANEGYNSAILIAGPQNTGTIGEEIGITTGYITVAGGENHIENSIIQQSLVADIITIGGDLKVTGSISGSTIEGLGNATAFSTSVDSRLDSVEASLGGGGSIGIRVTALEAFTSSQETKNTTLQTYTASVDSRLNQLSTDTGSQNTRITTLESKATTLQTYTASVDSRLNQLSTDTGSQNTRITTLESKATTLESVTSSFLIETANLETFSASALIRLSNIQSTTASLLIETANLETFSASALLRLSSLETNTGSQNTRITTLESKATTLQTYTASVDSRLNQLSTASGSAIGRLNNLESFTSSTFPTFSTSVDSRLDTLEGAGTIQGVGQGNAVTFASINSVGNLTVGGDLVVEGNSVTLNTSILVVEDKTIQLASGSTNAATANGAGIEVLGANATFTYASSPNAWTANIPFSASAFTGSFNVPGGASTKRIAFRNTNDNISFVSAPTTSGDLVQWDGSDFVMSNVIDGGSF